MTKKVAWNRFTIVGYVKRFFTETAYAPDKFKTAFFSLCSTDKISFDSYTQKVWKHTKTPVIPLQKLYGMCDCVNPSNGINEMK